jgi:hypothetical protein
LAPTPVYSLTAAGAYYVIGGQHIVGAVGVLRDEWRQLQRKFPFWLNEVEAIVLRNSTDVSTRELIAGILQQVSGTQAPPTVVDMARQFLKDLKRDEDAVDLGNEPHPIATTFRLAWNKTAPDLQDSKNRVCDTCPYLFLYTPAPRRALDPTPRWALDVAPRRALDPTPRRALDPMIHILHRVVKQFGRSGVHWPGY